MTVLQADVKVLWAKSGNCCAICCGPLIHDAYQKTVPIGQQAHIKGEHSGNVKANASARYDADQDNIERNSYDNLILLCPTCHTIIDKDETKYTVEILNSIKSKHEQKIAEAIKTNTLNVTYYELEHTLRHLVSNKNDINSYDLTVIPPKDKIVKNNLGPSVERLIQAGLLGSRQVEDFLNQNADMGYSEKIRKAFVDNYEKLRNEGVTGDDLFYSLMNVASNGNSDSRYMAAGLNVLVYYFHLCEVFEK
jgi:hypothetical protein